MNVHSHSRRRAVVRAVLSSVLATLLVSLLIVPAAQAGNGRVRVSGSKRLLDFCVSVRFQATPEQLAEVRRAFTDASAVIADATDGQFEFGNVTIVNDSWSHDQAEVWIMPQAGRAYGTYNRYGVFGQHVTLFYPGNVSKAQTAAGDAYSIAHEFMHHVWGLADEYYGPTGTAECEPPPGTGATNFCLMDDFFRRGGNRGRTATTSPWHFTLNELCVRGNHDPDKDTWQEDFHHKSCWDALAAHPTRGATVPVESPVDAAPSVSAPVFKDGAPQRRFVLVLDRSGSMSDKDNGPNESDRLTLAKQAAGVFMALLSPGDQIGIVSFSDYVTTELPLTTITGMATKQEARDIIYSLTADGYTAIGNALNAANELLTTSTTSCCAQYVVLFTDGENNVGVDELSTVPTLRDAGITVTAIGIGRSVSWTNLAKVAAGTSGRYFQVSASSGLPALLAALTVEATASGVIARSSGYIAEGQSVIKDLDVEAGAKELTVVLTTDPSTVVELRIKGADGLIYSSDPGTIADLRRPASAGAVYSASSDPAVEFVSAPGTRIATIRTPTLVQGTYEVRLTGRTVPSPGYRLTAGLRSAAYLTASSTQPEYTYPNPARISAVLAYQHPVVGASVRAIVVTPSGRRLTIDMHDDGSEAHNDDAADDGVYGAVFGDFLDGPGAYRVDVVGEALPGAMTYAGDVLYADFAPSNAAPVPQFRRETSITVVATGISAGDFDGDGLTDTWEIAHGLNAGSAVGINGGQGDPDGDGVTNLQEVPLGSHPFVPNTWILSEGSTGFFTERLAVANPFTQRANFRVTYLREGGAPIARDYSLPSRQRMTIDLSGIPELANSPVSSVVTTTAGTVAVERTMIWDARNSSNYGGHTGKAVPAARTEWYLAEGEARFFDTYILLANANTTAAEVTATYLLDTGDPVVRSYTVPGQSRFTIWANGIPGVSQHAFSATFRSDVPIIVERAMYFTTDGRFWTGGHASAAVAAPSTSWFVAEGRTGSLFDMYLLLANPGTKATNARIRYLLPGGGVIAHDYELPPTSRTTVYVDGIAGLEDTDVSAAITSGEPIIVERAMYWPDPFPHWIEAHNSAGVTELGTEWVLAEGQHGGAASFATYILLANPGETDAQVTITILRDGYTLDPIELTRFVPANARLTLPSGDIPGLGSGEQFGAHIVSDQPIVVERAMYWNALGQFWGGGTNESGVRIR